MKFEDVITEQEYNNIRRLSYKDFCNYLGRFTKLCVEESLKALPSVITHLVNHTAYVKKLSEDFYDNNRDLADKKLIVTKVIEQIEAENPGLGYEDVLKKAAPRVRDVVAKMGKTDTNAERGDLGSYDSKLKDI